MFHCLLLILFVVVFIPVVYHLSKHKLSTHAGIHLIFSCLDFKYGSVFAVSIALLCFHLHAHFFHLFFTSSVSISKKINFF